RSLELHAGTYDCQILRRPGRVSKLWLTRVVRSDLDRSAPIQPAGRWRRQTSLGGSAEGTAVVAARFGCGLPEDFAASRLAAASSRGRREARLPGGNRGA